MSIIDRIFSLENSATTLSDVMSLYLSVVPDQIMNCLTEYEVEATKMWADDNSLDISDMLDIIQHNLNSKVEFSVTPGDYMNNRLLVNSKLIIVDNGKAYNLSLVWYLGE